MKWLWLVLVLMTGCQRGAESQTSDRSEPRIEVSEPVIPEREEAIKNVKTPPTQDEPVADPHLVEVRNARLEGNEVTFDIINTGSKSVMSATVEIIGRGALGRETLLSPRAGHVCFFAGPLDPSEKSSETFPLPRHALDGASVVGVVVNVLEAK